MNCEADADVLEEQCNEYAEEESESTDGFQTYTAAEAFVQGLAGLVNQSDVETMIRAQKQMLQRFEKTNEMLLNCNALSQSRLKGANDDFKRHVKLLNEMKKDLDYIFRKVRNIKQKLNQQYAVAFAEAQTQHIRLVEEEDAAEDREVEKSAKKESKESNTTVEYVQMQEAIENGKPIENELIKRVCSIETANPNDSSDCTSEDTG